MPWTCPQDGTDVPDNSPSCSLCGYVRFPSGVVLRSDATGNEVQVRLDSTLGAAALMLLGDPEVRFVSSQQFKIEKRRAHGGWAIVNLPYATNPMFLNGAPIAPLGVILKDGDRISIKDKYFRLSVRLLG